MADEEVELERFIPRASPQLCHDCKRPKTDWNHSQRNHRGHYFNANEEATIADRRDLNAKEKPTPHPMAEDDRPCRTCRQTRLGGHHRGRGSHPYDPPPPAPERPTQAAIVQALEQALAGMGICKRLLIRKSSVEPQYGVDGSILMARINIAAVLFFEAPGEQLPLPGKEDR